MGKRSSGWGLLHLRLKGTRSSLILGFRHTRQSYRFLEANKETWNRSSSQSLPLSCLQKTLKKRRGAEPAIKRLNSSLSLPGGPGRRLLLSQLFSPSPPPMFPPPTAGCCWASPHRGTSFQAFNLPWDSSCKERVSVRDRTWSQGGRPEKPEGLTPPTRPPVPSVCEPCREQELQLVLEL